MLNWAHGSSVALQLSAVENDIGQCTPTDGGLTQTRHGKSIDFDKYRRTMGGDDSQ